MSGLNPTAILAVARRQLGSFLANPIGYIFILAFVVVTAAATFVPDEFFHRSIADFGVIYQEMTWILLVLLPALGMGAWAGEREHGTEELLLTMPVSVADAVLGKFLAVAGFFTLAMLCNLSNVGMLMWIGDPDLGQIAANYVGWWLLGLGYAALALLGSAMVASNAIAFVLGVLLCAAYGLLVWRFDLLAPYNRGLLALDLAMVTLAVVAAGVGSAIFVLASRRWQSDRMGAVAIQILCLVLTVAVAVNLARIGGKWQMQTDLSVANISSLTEESRAILRDLPYPTEVVVVVSDESVLPEDLESKAQELLYKARALERESGGTVEVTLLRPTDPFDEAGTRAREHYDLETRNALMQTVVGNEEVEVFLGAYVKCSEKTQTIEYFDPGLSVEYELIRALRRVTTEAGSKPPVTVTIVASEDVPPSGADRLAALLGWRDSERPEVSVAVQRVADARAAAERYGLEVLTLEAEPAADDPAATDGDTGAEAGDADASSEDADAEVTTPAAAPPPVEMVLGAVVEGPRFSARVRSFTDADAVDSALLDAIRTARRKLPVLGVLDTALQMGGGFNMAAMGQSPEWGMVSEWGKQYDIRQLTVEDLGPQLDDVDALVVALPSSLPPEGMAALSEWIWSGRPTLMLVDPLPMLPLQQGRAIAPGMPPEPRGGGMMGRQQPGEPKAGIEGVTPLLRALSLRVDLVSVLWSNYTPSLEFSHLPKEFVWIDQTQGTYAEGPIMRGVQTLLFPSPGRIEVVEGGELEVTPLVTLGVDDADRREPWGVNGFRSYLGRDMFGRTSLEIPRTYVEQRAGAPRPVLAARVAGSMAFPDVDGETDIAPGTPSPGSIDVVVVADTDVIHDGVFNIYRSVSTGQESEAPAELTRLRNVQWMENVVDVLIGNDELLDLRAHRPGRRSLTKMDALRSRHRKEKVEKSIVAQQTAERARDEARQELQAQLAAISQREDIDRVQRENMRRYAELQGNQRLEQEIARIDRQNEVEQRKLDIAFREAVAEDRRGLRWLMVGIPAAVLALLVAAVTAVRLAKEHTDIPVSRDRRKA